MGTYLSKQDFLDLGYDVDEDTDFKYFLAVITSGFVLYGGYLYYLS